MNVKVERRYKLSVLEMCLLSLPALKLPSSLSLRQTTTPHYVIPEEKPMELDIGLKSSIRHFLTIRGASRNSSSGQDSSDSPRGSSDDTTSEAAGFVSIYHILFKNISLIFLCHELFSFFKVKTILQSSLHENDEWAPHFSGMEGAEKQPNPLALPIMCSA